MKRPTPFFLMICGMLSSGVFAQEPETKSDTLKMTSDTLLLEGVSIVADRPLFSVEGEKTLYQVSDDPTVQSGMASDALQNAPGVSVDVEGNVTLRGASDVEVWINDQPSNLTQESLKVYLRTLPANAIERIEVITNPSARYATQADGIINIVTNTKVKRNEFLCFGMNGSSQPYVMPWASYIWKNDRWTVNLYSNMYFYHGNSEESSEKTLYSEDENGNPVVASLFKAHTKSSNNSYSPGLNINLTYTPDQKNTFSFYSMLWDSFGPSELRQERERVEYLEQSGDYQYSILTKSRSNYMYLPFGLNYRHLFNEEGHNLSLRLNGSLNRYAIPIYYHKTFTSPMPYERAFVNDYSTTNIPISANVDYNLPYSQNGEFGLGLNASWEGNDVVNSLDSLADGGYVHDSVMSYRFRLVDHSMGGYVQMRHRFGNFTVQPSVSLQYYHTSIAYPNATAYNFATHYWNVKPSLHLSYHTATMHNFKVSYSMRVQNPSAEQLSPFIKFDEEMFASGNPDLQQVFTHNLEGSWTKYWDDFGSVGLTGYYKGRSNVINYISEAAYHDYYGRVVTFQHPVNVGWSYNTGGEFNMMYRPNGMLNLRLYANLYDSYIETNWGNDNGWVKNRMLCYSLRLNFWSKLWDRLEVHASAYYNSPTQTLFGQKGSSYSLDCGLRSDFFDHKLSVFVNGYDLFGLLKNQTVVSSPTASSTSISRYNSSCVCAGFTLRFGNVELENEVQTGGEDAGR